jgi:Tol biopolymer transport system component
MNVDGKGLQRVTNHPERDDYPTWHPNGRQLAVVSERDGMHDLYLLTIEDAAVTVPAPLIHTSNRNRTAE